MTLVLFSGAWRKLIYEQNLKQKISWLCPFTGTVLKVLLIEGVFPSVTDYCSAVILKFFINSGNIIFLILSLLNTKSWHIPQLLVYSREDCGLWFGSTPAPYPTLSRSQAVSLSPSSCVSPVYLTDGGGWGGGRGAKSYDRKKAWASINPSNPLWCTLLVNVLIDPSYLWLQRRGALCAEWLCGRAHAGGGAVPYGPLLWPPLFALGTWCAACRMTLWAGTRWRQCGALRASCLTWTGRCATGPTGSPTVTSSPSPAMPGPTSKHRYVGINNYN